MRRALPALALFVLCVYWSYLVLWAQYAGATPDDPVLHSIGSGGGVYVISGFLAAVTRRATGDRTLSLHVWWYGALGLLLFTTYGRLAP